MDSIKISEQLKKLASNNEKRTKSSQLNDVFNDVENALKSGISRQSVIELLAENGLVISMKSFESTLARLRGKRKKEIKNSQVIAENPLKTNQTNDIFSQGKITEYKPKEIITSDNDDDDDGYTGKKLTRKELADREIDAMKNKQPNNPLLRKK